MPSFFDSDDIQVAGYSTNGFIQAVNHLGKEIEDREKRLYDAEKRYEERQTTLTAIAAERDALIVELEKEKAKKSPPKLERVYLLQLKDNDGWWIHTIYHEEPDALTKLADIKPQINESAGDFAWVQVYAVR